MIEVFIPYTNEAVWKPLPTGAAGILARLRTTAESKPRRELQEPFENWAVDHMTYDWGLDIREGGMAFQFELESQAVLFKLTWGGR